VLAQRGHGGRGGGIAGHHQQAGALAVQVAADFQAALDDFGLAAATIGAVSLVSQIGNGPVRQGSLHGTPDG
jgi:hypothetical protein